MIATPFIVLHWTSYHTVEFAHLFDRVFHFVRMYEALFRLWIRIPYQSICHSHFAKRGGLLRPGKEVLGPQLAEMVSHCDYAAKFVAVVDFIFSVHTTLLRCRARLMHVSTLDGTNYKYNTAVAK